MPKMKIYLGGDTQLELNNVTVDGDVLLADAIIRYTTSDGRCNTRTQKIETDIDNDIITLAVQGMSHNVQIRVSDLIEQDVVGRSMNSMKRTYKKMTGKSWNRTGQIKTFSNPEFMFR